MKKIFLLTTAIACLQTISAQMDVPPVGGNPRAKITEEVGITDITISYSRPDVNRREGKIWGDGNVVTYGFTTFSFMTNRNTAPWRAGANENTIITFEHDVKVEGKNLKAGAYGVHMAVWPDSVLIIFSNQTDAWGSFYYEDKYDALRVTVKPVVLDKSVEWLRYEFTEHREKGCTIAMLWEKLMIPFKVEVDVDNIVLKRLRDQTTSQKGFNSTNLIQAAQYCINKNINLEEALVWSQRAITGFNGQKSYASLRNLAVVYEKLQKTAQVDSVMAEAITMANANQLTGYGRTLIAQKRADKALEVLLANQKKNGDVYVVNSGLAYGYSARGDYKKALAAAEKALTQAPNDNVKKTVEGQIVKLKEGKDIN